jgi:hypothetical protein
MFGGFFLVMFLIACLIGLPVILIINHWSWASICFTELGAGDLKEIV